MLDVIGNLLQKNIGKLKLITISVLVIYVLFLLNFHNEALHKLLYLKLKFGNASIAQVMPLIKENGLFLLMRSLLKGISTAFATATVFGVFYNMRDYDFNSITIYIAQSSFIIYLWHTMPVFCMQGWFLESQLPGILKGLVVFVVASIFSCLFGVLLLKLKKIIN